MRKLFVIIIVLLQFKAIAQVKLAGSYGLDLKVQQFLEVVHSYDGLPLQEL